MKVIGLWNSGSPAPKADIDKGLARLDELGLAAVFPRQSRRWASRPESKTRAFLAGPDSAKIEALEELVASREIRDVLALRGGYGGIRLLPLLDRARSIVKRYDKMLWGYSDLTVTQHYFYSKCGAPWVHSPMLGSTSFHTPHPLEARWWKKSGTRTHTHDSLSLRLLSATDASRRRDRVRGVLLGGNLASFVTLMGTPWEPRLPASTLLFFEDVKEPPYKMDRLLHQLGGHRDIRNVKAVVLGHFTDSPHAFQILKLWSENLSLPAYRGILAGHQDPHLPLQLGMNVTLEAHSASRAQLVVPTAHLGV